MSILLFGAAWYHCFRLSLEWAYWCARLLSTSNHLHRISSVLNWSFFLAEIVRCRVVIVVFVCVEFFLIKPCILTKKLTNWKGKWNGEDFEKNTYIIELRVVSISLLGSSCAILGLLGTALLLSSCFLRGSHRILAWFPSWSLALCSRLCGTHSRWGVCKIYDEN